MSTIKQWQSKTAAILTLAMTATTAAPLLMPTSALAQTRQNQSQQYDYRILSGAQIPVTYDDAERIVVAPDETAKLTLTVAQDILARDRTLLIPQGSKIMGEVRPVRGGSQFVAQQLVFPNNRQQSINANSRVVTRTEEVRRGPNATSVIAGAAVGSAAAAIISGLSGDRRIDALEVLAGTGAGAAGGAILGRRAARVVVINPETDLNLTLRSDLLVSRYGFGSDFGSTINNPRNDRYNEQDRGI